MVAVRHITVWMTRRPTNDTMPWPLVAEADVNFDRMQMSRIRRLAASFLIVLLVPSLALAATPLRYCIGPSGHQALEFVIDGISHSGNHASHGHSSQDADDCSDAGSTAFLDAERCTDTALMDTASAPPVVDLKHLSVSSLFAQPLFVMPAASADELRGSLIANSHKPQLVDPRVAIRRTTVLLI